MRPINCTFVAVIVAAVGCAGCSKSADTLEQECVGGSAVGCYEAGELYFAGEGVEQDREKAVQLFERACEGREQRGCDRAAEVYEAACQEDRPMACSLLGRMYLDGFGVAADPARAAGLYERACDLGEPISCVNLAMLYSEGTGVARDAEKAAGLRAKACEAGFKDACDKVETPETPTQG